MRSVFVLQTIFSSLPIFTNAHMEMSWPYPIRSQFDPAVAVADKDYSYTSPLFANGSNFPCKGYQTGVDADIVKAVYMAGGTYNMSLAGTITHDGGSCQLSLSYDNGASFKVIESMIGGCPLVPSYNFTVPSFAPSSTSVLFAWSWFNLVGDREMYMNCARVEIQAPATSRVKRSYSWKRQMSMDQLPDMFVCNVNNGCTTIEGQDVDFPYPGNAVIYGQDLVTPSNGSGFTGSGFTGDTPPNGTFNGTTTYSPFGNSSYSMTFSTSSTFISLATLTSTTSDIASLVTVTTDGSIATSVNLFTTATPSLSARSILPISPTSSASDPCPDMTSSPAATYSSHLSLWQFTTVFPTPSTMSTSTLSAVVQIASSAVSSQPTTLPTTCTPGTFFCNSPSSFSACVSPNYSTTGANFIYMGDVAAGMQCVDSQIIRQNDGPCTPSGQIFCDGSNAFYMVSPFTTRICCAPLLPPLPHLLS